jgi:hypothetical protein
MAKVCGDDEIAKECWSGANCSLNALPVVGHAKGWSHYAVGDIKGGNHVMKRATDTSLGMMGSMPGVGNTKGLVHCALNNTEGGDKAMLAATRSTAVMGAGAEWDLGTALVTSGKKMDGICRIIDKPTKVDSYFDAGLSMA